MEGVLVQQGRNPNVTSSALPAACLISQLFWLLKVRAKRGLKDSKCQTLAYFSCKSDHCPDAWISFQGWSEDSVDQTHPRCLNILADKLAMAVGHARSYPIVEHMAVCRRFTPF
jgi:hypothetical protein